MTKTRKKSTSARPLLLAAALTVGCRGGEYYKLGQKAEQKGDSAAAYDHYARAAARHRTGFVGDSLARTRPAAAAHAERTGLAALDDGRYDDAWRSFMRTLDIQPNHATAVQLVRQLEDDYPDEIAATKHEWLTRGSASLSPPERRTLAMAPPPSPPPPPPPPRETTAPPATSVRGTALAETPKATAVEPKQTERPAPVPNPKDLAVSDRSVAVATGLPRGEAGRPPPPDLDLEPVPPAELPFTSIHMLSLKDRRYARLALAVDGIGVKLKDTEKDGEVDLDLFDGKKRIQKVRDLELGRSQTFRGKSGTLYRLTLLGVHHKSRTVRLGVKRA